MTRKSDQAAIIYCRVSTKKQATEGSGLSSQETRCREYAAHRRHKVVKVFCDDVSGSLASRPGFDDMLLFIAKNRALKPVVIIDDISRMARDVRNHFNLKESIFRAGATLESPSIEFGDDSDSVLIENLLASVSQHQRQKNGEQAANRMRARMLNGFWVHNPPIGYRYEKSPQGGSVLVRVEPLASIIAEGLEGYAAGRFNSKPEVKRFLEAHAGFPVCRHGFLTNQQIHRIMTHPIYAGYLESKAWDVSFRKAQHEGVITLATFERVQEKLKGKTYAAARKDINEDFPLRGFVKCGCCGHPLTANWSQGRSKKHPYYVCRHRGCEMFGKSVRRDTVEGAFEDLLQDMAPSPVLFDMMLTLFKKRWDASENQTRERQRVLKSEIATLERKIASTLDLMLESDNRTVISAYERKIDELERRKLVMSEKISLCGKQAKGFDETFRTAITFLSSPWILWENGSLADRHTVLKLTLAEHLEYDWKGGVRTAKLSMPFRLLMGNDDPKNDLADRVGFEPTVEFPPRRFSRPLP
jgi:site-specific DNA recombinase